MRRVQFMWKWSGSGNGSCPSLLETDGGYIVIGQHLDSATLATVEAVAGNNDSGIGPGEGAVFVPDEVLDRLKGS